MSPHLGHEAPRQPPDEVEALAARFLAQLQAGENPDPQALVRAHPHLAARLERRLALAEMVYRVGLGPQGGRPSVTETVQPTGPSPDPHGGAAGSPGRPGENIPDFELLGLLGHGGMGVVYKARQISLPRVVALKMIRTGDRASPDLLARFQAEAEALARLQHPNIVQVYKVGAHDGCPYLAMEVLDGGGLDRQLAGRPQPPRAAAELVETLARAMHCAHARGIVHRDLKPANILLQRRTTTDNTDSTDEKKCEASLSVLSVLSVVDFIPKIADFGLAKRLEAGRAQTLTGAVLGTPSYMAPEQAAGAAHAAGPPADVYALGALLYECLTGRPPFRGPSPLETLRQVQTEEPVPPSRLQPGVPRDLETVCLKCLQKEPGKRYASALALADDLRRFLGNEPVRARPVSRPERAVKWARRRPAAAALVGLSTLLVVGGGAEACWHVARVRAERDAAERNFRRAFRAVDEMLAQVAEEPPAGEPRTAEGRRELLERALRFYQECLREGGDDPAVRKEAALASGRMGDFLRLLGRYDEAAEAYRQGIRRLDALVAEFPDDPACREALANCHNFLGELCRTRGEAPGAGKE
jgi:serine/threonine protein kinase